MSTEQNENKDVVTERGRLMAKLLVWGFTLALIGYVSVKYVLGVH